MTGTTTRLAALAAAVVIVTAGLVPVSVAAADDSVNSPLEVEVAQGEDGGVTVTVTNGTVGVSNATVEVAAVNGSYPGVGSYETAEDGTVSLPAPTENVTVAVTGSINGSTTSTTARLATADEFENFGLEVSTFVERLQGSNGTNDEPLGLIIADFVTANNPGQGPPADAGPPGDAGERGPPEDAGPGGDAGERGPPEDAGPGGDDRGSGNGADGERGPPDDRGPPEDAGPGGNGGGGDGQGPPDDAGPPGDDEDEETTDDSDDSDDSEDGDDGQGPPDDAGSGGNGDGGDGDSGGPPDDGGPPN